MKGSTSSVEVDAEQSKPAAESISGVKLLLPTFITSGEVLGSCESAGTESEENKQNTWPTSLEKGTGDRWR